MTALLDRPAGPPSSSSTRLPAFENAFSLGMAGVSGSALRDMLRMAQVPGLVNFAGGLPAPELFPMAEIEAAAETALQRHGWRAMQYGAKDFCRCVSTWPGRDCAAPA